MTIQEGNKLIAEFMGIKWQPATHMTSHSLRTYEPVYDTYKECEDVCEKENRALSGSPRLMKHFQPVPVINSISRELKYHTSWDWLMPVVEKIDNLEIGVWTIRPRFVAFQSWKGEQRPERQFNFNTSQMDWEREDDEAVEFVFLVYQIVIQAIAWHNTNNPKTHPHAK